MRAVTVPQPLGQALASLSLEYLDYHAHVDAATALANALRAPHTAAAASAPLRKRLWSIRYVHFITSIIISL